MEEKTSLLKMHTITWIVEAECSWERRISEKKRKILPHTRWISLNPRSSQLSESGDRCLHLLDNNKESFSLPKKRQKFPSQSTRLDHRWAISLVLLFHRGMDNRWRSLADRYSKRLVRLAMPSKTESMSLVQKGCRQKDSSCIFISCVNDNTRGLCRSWLTIG